MAHIQPTRTITFKSIGDLHIQLDVFLPDQPNNVPVFLWFHGGGLLQGHRNQIAAYMRRSANQYHLAVVSADYRFCPQASVAEVLTDVQDLIAFIRQRLATQLPSNAINPSRLAVSGSSAGGYLALLAGLYADPKPDVIAPIYPITDPFGTFFTNPQPPPMGRRLASREELVQCLDPSAPQQANCGPLNEDPRMDMYVYMMSAANLGKLYHLDLDARPDEATKFRISRNVYDRGLPPTYLLHGDADSCVGVEQADEVAGALAGCGVEFVYERVHGKDHFLDTAEDYQNDKMFEFVLRHLSK